ncbi:hypothetical protein [Duganella phyllosphaerae]|uniref:hypothetical protein n=1 Tax=Duganella phyllosphaerae TaxID=762836 RepID=UPI00114D084C|nr:hypothetical protein [Duganella phyllosphaerae]
MEATLGAMGALAAWWRVMNRFARQVGDEILLLAAAGREHGEKNLMTRYQDCIKDRRGAPTPLNQGNPIPPDHIKETHDDIRDDPRIFQRIRGAAQQGKVGVGNIRKPMRCGHALFRFHGPDP